jgi:hypothetical protein
MSIDEMASRLTTYSAALLRSMPPYIQAQVPLRSIFSARPVYRTKLFIRQNSDTRLYGRGAPDAVPLWRFGNLVLHVGDGRAREKPSVVGA